jgi:hypothetical protein
METYDDTSPVQERKQCGEVVPMVNYAPQQKAHEEVEVWVHAVISALHEVVSFAPRPLHSWQ